MRLGAGPDSSAPFGMNAQLEEIREHGHRLFELLVR
jgi:hypothetical protein